MTFREVLWEMGLTTSTQDVATLKERLIDAVLRHYALEEWDSLPLREKVEYLADIFRGGYGSDEKKGTYDWRMSREQGKERAQVVVKSLGSLAE